MREHPPGRRNAPGTRSGDTACHSALRGHGSGDTARHRVAGRPPAKQLCPRAPPRAPPSPCGNTHRGGGTLRGHCMPQCAPGTLHATAGGGTLRGHGGTLRGHCMPQREAERSGDTEAERSGDTACHRLAGRPPAKQLCPRAPICGETRTHPVPLLAHPAGARVLQLLFAMRPWKSFANSPWYL